MQKIFYEKEIDLLHQLKELVSLTVDESIDYKIEDHGVRAVGSLAIKGEYISQEKRHFLENVELDVYADDQKIIDRQDFHLKVEDFHYDIIDGNLKIKIEVGVYGVEEGENRYIQLDEDPIDEIEKLSRDVETQTINEQVVAEAPEEIHDVEKLQENFHALMAALVKAKPAAAKGQYIKSVSVSSTMGPGAKINPTKVLD